MKRSVSDSQNYGDDVPAQDLINPPAFSELSIDAMAFADRKNKPYVRQVSQSLNQSLKLNGIFLYSSGVLFHVEWFIRHL